jgi:hypothetical protein
MERWRRRAMHRLLLEGAAEEHKISEAMSDVE